MEERKIGALIIGDEILSGKRADKHMAKLIELLGTRGLRLAWCEYHGDVRPRLVETLRRSFASGDIVFSFGGIGVTPDDHTREAAAEALGVAVALHSDARREIEARFGGEVTPLRLKLGEFPVGSEIIPNPYNRIPGFSIREHHFVPGFPVMAWPMVEWVLDTRYRELFHRVLRVERSLVLYEGLEGQLMPLMNEVTASWPDLRLFSLPSFGDETTRRHVELGVEGDPVRVAQAIARMREEAKKLGLEFEERQREERQRGG